MAIITANPVASRWYTPASQEGEESPAKFKIRPLDGEQLSEAMYQAKITENGGIELHPDGMRSALRNGLIDWQNVMDTDGNEIPFSRTAIRLLPWTERLDLAGEIINISFMTEDEEKNS